MQTLPEKIILGIDPGTNVLGYGLIRCQQEKISLLSLGVVHLDKYKEQQIKLRKIFEKITHLIKHYQPDEVAIEAPFYGKNVQSMLKLGRAQGVAMVASSIKNLSVYEYAPKKIKQSITGNGNASKEQVAAMLKGILNFEKNTSYLDATDALAAALCHHFQRNNPVKTGNYKSWNDFIVNNPGKVKK